MESSGLYGNSILQKTEVDHWLTFCLGPLSCGAELPRALTYLESVLLPTTFLVGTAVRQDLNYITSVAANILVSILLTCLLVE